MSITNFYIIDVTEFKKKNTKFIFYKISRLCKAALLFCQEVPTRIFQQFFLKLKTVDANLNPKWHFGGNVVVYVYGSLDQSVKLSWAKPFRLASSRMSPSLNPVWTLNVITLLGGGLLMIWVRLVDIGPTSSGVISPVPSSSWAIPSAVSFDGWYSNLMSFNSLLGLRIRKTMFNVRWLTST